MFYLCVPDEKGCLRKTIVFQKISSSEKKETYFKTYCSIKFNGQLCTKNKQFALRTNSGLSAIST